MKSYVVRVSKELPKRPAPPGKSLTDGNNSSMEARMSHYTLTSRSRPDLQRLARRADRARSEALKQGLRLLTIALTATGVVRRASSRHPGREHA